MGQILVKEQIPGAGAARAIIAKLENLDIYDVKLLYDKNIIPHGMWAVVQVQKRASIFVMPENYASTDLEPYILWWCKDDQSKFREPNDQDLMDIITIVKRAPDIWAQGEKRADKFDELDVDKDRKHKEKFKQKIHEIAPAMKKAIKSGNI